MYFFKSTLISKFFKNWELGFFLLLFLWPDPLPQMGRIRVAEGTARSLLLRHGTLLIRQVSQTDQWCSFCMVLQPTPDKTAALQKKTESVFVVDLVERLKAEAPLTGDCASASTWKTPWRPSSPSRMGMRHDKLKFNCSNSSVVHPKCVWPHVVARFTHSLSLTRPEGRSTSVFKRASLARQWILKERGKLRRCKITLMWKNGPLWCHKGNVCLSSRFVSTPVVVFFKLL